VRKEWAEDAHTMAAQGWLPIKFPGRTKTTSDLGLVTLLRYHHQAYRDDTPLTLLFSLFKCKW